MAIRFFSEDIDFKLKNKQLLIKWLNGVITNSGKKTGTINYIFCPDAYLLDLNIKYLCHNTLTDIITFPADTNTPLKVAGDIYISIERIAENAILYNTTPYNELQRVMAHGILHLLGYNDKTNAEKQQMRQAEDACLTLLDK